MVDVSEHLPRGGRDKKVGYHVEHEVCYLSQVNSLVVVKESKTS